MTHLWPRLVLNNIGSQISWIPEAARLDVMMSVPLWNVSGISEIRLWITNFINNVICDVVVHPCTSVNDGLAKPNLSHAATRRTIIVYKVQALVIVRNDCAILTPFVKNHTTFKLLWPGPAFIKPDQLDPWIKDQIGNTLLSTILHLQLPNFVSCGRDKPSHMTQNLVTVGVKL